MREMHSAWLELSVLASALGAVWARTTGNPAAARRRSIVASGLALAFAAMAWWASISPSFLEIPGPWAAPQGFLTVDEMSGPLLPLAALIYFLAILATLRAKVREFSFARALASEAIVLATLGCTSPWGLVVLLSAGTMPQYLELRAGRKPSRVYAAHMALFVALLSSGQAMQTWGDGSSALSLVGVSMLTAAVLIRCGAVPVHCWMPDLFEHATFGMALLFVTPMTGAYAAARLVLPVAPHWALQSISLASLTTATYAAGMTIVQRDARRFFCYLFLSHSSLVLVGLDIATPLGLTAALCLWLSASVSLTGFGLVLRCVESRIGRVALLRFHGLYQHIPMLAALFLTTGLASVGFPGTAGFIGLELLVEGVVRVQPLEGVGIVVVAALNGLAVMHAYLRIFAGRPHVASIDLGIRPAERGSVLILTLLVLGGGLCPQPVVTTLYRAARGLAESRRILLPCSSRVPGAP